MTIIHRSTGSRRSTLAKPSNSTLRPWPDGSARPASSRGGCGARSRNVGKQEACRRRTHLRARARPRQDEDRAALNFMFATAAYSPDRKHENLRQHLKFWRAHYAIGVAARSAAERRQLQEVATIVDPRDFRSVPQTGSASRTRFLLPIWLLQQPPRDSVEDLREFQSQFATEDACGGYLSCCRWPDGFVCPQCGNRSAHELIGLGRWQ